VNGEDRRRKVAFLLLALAAVMAVASAAFAVEISLNDSDIARIGGTGNVEVHCPAAGNPCKIDKVYWVLSFPPPRVTAVKIYWTPAATGTYDVYVVLYDNNGNMISNGYGSTSEDITSTDPTTTTVNLASPVNPALIKYVEIAIVEHVET
jgi:type 1 fimbria pilin